MAFWAGVSYVAKSMAQFKFLPWKELDILLDEEGEWVLLVSIATMGLPPFPGIIMLWIALRFLDKKSESRRPPEFRRYYELSEKEKLTKAEELELSEYDYGKFVKPPRKMNELYRMGGFGLIFAVIYQLLSTWFYLFSGSPLKVVF